MRPDRDAVLEEPVIWISDDETDTETTFENSVMVIEPSVAELHLEERASEEAVGEDSDLVVTFCRRGSVMPHARYDCPTRPFERTENESSLPVGLNSETCVQCYCYVCDKLASECPSWTSAPSCHCNAHNKSKYWKDERSRTLAGILVTFNLELVEIDADLRRGGEHLLLFTQELAAAYTRYLKGETPPSSQACCACWLRPNVGRCYICRRRRRNKEPVYRYSEIFNLVSSFISQAEKETPKTSAIMLLGAVREIALHKDPALRWENMGTTESLKLAVPLLMARMTQLLQRTLVLGDLPQPLCQKFTRFFQAVPLPPYCFGFTNCLNVAPWDHRLLTTVLRGQNITGPRRRSGKKEFLWEVFAVVRARVERLEGLGQYRELVRYLKAVKCEDSVGLRDLRDKVPFYLCKCGDFTGAAYALLSPVNTLACCTACRLTPAHFESYLKMLWTGGVPAGNDIQDTGHWTVSVGVAVKPWILMKQALRMLFGNQALYQNARCWSALLALWGSSPVLEQSGLLTMLTLQAPSFSFQKKVLRASDAILQELRLHGNATLPADLFFGPLGLEACLLLCTQAAREMLVTEFPWLTSLLDIILAFGKNLWALKVFLEGVSKTPAIYEVIGMISRDLSYQKYTLLRLWQILGPDYVGELLCLLLGFRSIDLQTVGVLLTRLMVENLSQCPWAKSLDLHRLKALQTPHLDPTHLLQLGALVSALENV